MIRLWIVVKKGIHYPFLDFREKKKRKKKEKRKKAVFGLNNPDSDFPKKLHPLLTAFLSPAFWEFNLLLLLVCCIFPDI